MPERDYDPWLYDLVTGPSVAGDLEWYLSLAEEADGPILELGAGTGRITLPIARAGREITALDAAPEMLARLRHKLEDEDEAVRARVTVVEADMRHFSLEERFATVLIPFRAFLHCLRRDDQLACLRACHRHLGPGGMLALNVFHPSLDYMSRSRGPLEGLWRWIQDVPHPTGGIVICSEVSRFDTVCQRVHSKLRYEHLGEDGDLRSTHVKSLELAYHYPGDLRELLLVAGFDEVRIDGDFCDEPLARDGGELAVRAWRREGSEG